MYSSLLRHYAVQIFVKYQRFGGRKVYIYIYIFFFFLELEQPENGGHKLVLPCRWSQQAPPKFWHHLLFLFFVFAEENLIYPKLIFQL